MAIWRSKLATIQMAPFVFTYIHELWRSKNIFYVLVDFEKKGRIKLINLTKRGIEVADAIESIQKLIK